MKAATAPGPAEAIDAKTGAITIPRSTFVALNACPLLDFFVKGRAPGSAETAALEPDAARATADGGLEWPLGWTDKNLARTVKYPRALMFLAKNALIPLSVPAAISAIMKDGGAADPRSLTLKAAHGFLGPVKKVA